MLRWDKYESKVLYWVEEELEAEYEAHRSRTKRQTMEYDVETPVADAIGDFNAPITLNANEMRNGIEGRKGQYLWKFHDFYMGVSKNNGTSKSSILIEFSMFSIINHPFWGAPIFGNTHILGR